jgi:hypothetical protein
MGRTRPGTVAFAEVGLMSGRMVAGASQFEIVLRNGRAIRVGTSFDAAALRQLVRLVETDSEC